MSPPTQADAPVVCPHRLRVWRPFNNGRSAPPTYWPVLLPCEENHRNRTLRIDGRVQHRAGRHTWS